MPQSPVGQSVLRKEGVSKINGTAKYVDDLTLPGMIHGVTVRSPVPRGRLKDIRFGEGIPWKEFTIVTAKDLPGKNTVAHITYDQLCLAGEAINHPDEAVVLLAHPDRYLLEQARTKVTLEIEPLPAVLTIEDSLAKKQIIWGEDNIFKAFTIEHGNVEDVWSKAAHIVEGEYHTGAQEQLYIETNGMIGVWDPAGAVTVWGSMQCPFYVHKSLVTLFNLPTEKVRVVQAETGGGFGGKEDFPSALACHAALLSMKADGKPVKMIYDRAEDLAATTKRHPSRTRHRTAVAKDGRLLAMEIEFILDGGAYVTMSPVVLSRGGIHAAGPYSCPNVRVVAKAVATNTPPHGAFRGFGAPQSFFALERHMDKIATVVGLSPDELRRRNFVKKGDVLPTSQVLRDEVDLDGLMASALKHADYHEKKKRFAKENKTSRIKKGIGFSAFMHGGGFTGSGEKFLASIAAVEATAEGRVRVLASSTEMGQGARTVFGQITAGALGIDYDLVDVAQPDTSVVPNSGPTVASRTTMIVGKIVETAALGLKQTLKQAGMIGETYTSEEFSAACRRYIAEVGPLKSSSQYQQPPHIQWDDKTYRGDAYGTFAWAVYVAEVSVDTTTFDTTVDYFVAAQEIGKVVNPTLAEGQIEGGVVQGIGYALSEEVRYSHGRMINNRITNYIIPTAADVPRIDVLFAEDPYAFGPSGAKGIGELPMDGVAPAVINAVCDATGLDIDTIPLLPEKLHEAFQGSEAQP